MDALQARHLRRDLLSLNRGSGHARTGVPMDALQARQLRRDPPASIAGRVTRVQECQWMRCRSVT